MPYATTADIPDAAKKKLSPHQQEIFRSAFNNALREYGDESKAFATAWAAAKKGGDTATEKSFASVVGGMAGAHTGGEHKTPTPGPPPSQPIYRRLGAGIRTRKTSEVPHIADHSTVVAHPVGGEVEDEKYGPGRIVARHAETVGGQVQPRYHVQFDSGHTANAHHLQIAPAGQGTVHARMILKSLRGGEPMTGTAEGTRTRGALAKARDALLETLNLKSRQDDDEYDDNDEDDDEGAPSQEDREKAAAPKEAPPKGKGKGKGDDGESDDDQDDQGDESDDDEDDEGSAPAPAAAPQVQQQQAPPQQAPPQQPEMQQAPPSRGKKPPMPVRKSLEEVGDDDLMAEVRRRLEDPDTPEIMKSLAALPNAPEIFEAIDMSPAVASITQLAQEQLTAKDVIIARLTKSLAEITEGNNEIVAAVEVVLRALPEMVEQSRAIQKSLAAIGDDVALVKSQDNGRVSPGVRAIAPPRRVDPAALADGDDGDEEQAPKGMNTGRITRGLMKAMSPAGGGLIAEDQAMTWIGNLNGMTGMNGVWRQLPEPVREVVLATR